MSQSVNKTGLGYVQQVMSSHVFDSEFQIQTASLSLSAEYLALGGTDGLIEIWDFKKMKLDTDRLPYQGQELYMVHNSPVLALNFS